MHLKSVNKFIFLLVTVIIVMGGLAYWAVNTLTDSAKQLEALSAQKEAVSDLQMAFGEVVMPGNDYLITGSSEEKQLHLELDKEVQTAIEKVKGLISHQADQELVDKVASEYQKVKEKELKILALTNPVGNSAGAVLMEDMDGEAGVLSVDLEKLHDSIRKKEEATVKEISAKKKQVTTVMIFSVIASIIVGAVVTLSVRNLIKNVITPIEELGKTAEVVAEGDLTRNVALEASGEVGRLVESFKIMVDNLRKVIVSVSNSVNDISGISQGLAVNTQQAGTAAEQVAAAIQEVARGTAEQTTFISNNIDTVSRVTSGVSQIAMGAQEQARSISVTADMLSQMAASIQEVAKSAQNVEQSAGRTRETADKGEKAVSLTIDGISGIKTKVFETAIRIKELGEHSQKIGEIVRVIDDIAEQTNLLALNAAIEAARAGEHGKGFAVVADEVRKLAERSGKATKEIADLIITIQQLTSGVVKGMEQGTVEVEQGVNLALDAGSALKEIIHTVEDTYTQIYNISAAVEEISASSEEVVKALDAVSAITQQNSATSAELNYAGSTMNKLMENVLSITQESSAVAQEVSASTEELTASVEEISASSETMAKMAEDLNKMVAKFKV